MRRQINYKFIALVLACTAAVGILVHCLHAFQIARNAGGLRRFAEQAEAENRLRDAADYLRRYLAFAPEDTDCLERYGLVLHRLYQQAEAHPSQQTRGLAQRAFFALEQVLRRDETRSKVRRIQVDLAMAIRDFGAAKVHLLALNPKGNAELQRLLGTCESLLGNSEEAISCFIEAKKNAPHDLENYKDLAQLCQNLKPPKTIEADKYMGEMAEKNSRSIKAWILLAEYWIANGRSRNDCLAKAEKALRKGKELVLDRTGSPDHLELVFTEVKLKRFLADKLKSERDPDRRRAPLQEARLLLQAALKANPKSPRVYLELIDIERLEGRSPEAAKVLQAALTAHPENWDLLSYAADSEIQKGQLKEAQAFVDKLEAAPPVPGLQGRSRQIIVGFHRARMEAAQNQWAKARERLEKLAQTSEDHPLLESMQLLLGTCNERLGNPDQALLAYEKVVKSNPLSLAARAGAASVWASLGKHDKAVAEYRQLLALDGAPPGAHLALARLLILRNLRSPQRNRDWREVRAELARLDAVEVPVLLAESYVSEDPKGQFGKAREILKAALDKRPEQGSYWAALARLEAQRNLDDGLQILNKADTQSGLTDRSQVALTRMSLLARLPKKEALAALGRHEQELAKAPAADRVSLFWGLANAYFQANERGAAYRVLQQIAEGQANSLPLHLILFDLSLDQKKEDEQRRLAAAIKLLEGKDGSYWRQAEAILLVNEARAQRDSDKKHRLLLQAREYLHDVGKRRPLWYRVPALEAEIDLLEEMPERALEAYERAMALGDRRPGTVRGRVQLLFERKRYLEAEQAVSQLIDQEQTVLTSGLGKVAADLLLPTDTDRALDFARASVPLHSKNHLDHLWFGQVLARIGKPEHIIEAEKEFQRARELAPEAPESWIGSVAFLAKTNRLNEAREMLAQAKKRLRSAGVALAEGHEAVGEFREAEECFRSALKAKPEPAVIRNVAAFFVRSKQPEKAIPLLRKLVESTEKSDKEHVIWARRNLAVVLGMRRDYSQLREALRLVEQNIHAGENSRTDQRIKAILLASHPGHRNEALDLLEEANRQELLGGADLFVLARLYDLENNWSKAELCLLTLLGSPEAEKNPGYLAYYVRRLVDRKVLDNAAAWLKKLEGIAPNSWLTTDVKARFLQARNEHRAAMDLLGKQTQSKAFEKEIALLGDLAQHTASAEEYLRFAEELYRKAPVTSTNSLAYSQFLIRCDRLKEALPILDKLATQGSAEVAVKAVLTVLSSDQAKTPDYDQVDHWLRRQRSTMSLGVLLCTGHLRVRQGAYSEAGSIYKAVLEKEPHNQLALNNLAWLSAFHERDYPNALKLIDAAITAAGPTANLLDTRGIAKLLGGNTKAAIADLERSMAIKESGSAAFHLAQAHNRAGNRDAAATAFRKAAGAGLVAGKVHEFERHEYQMLQSALSLGKEGARN